MVMFSCDDCNVHYKTQKGLESHNEKHLGITYDCQECGKKFSQKSHLIVHLKSVHSAIPQLCKFCDKIFLEQTLLTEHLNSEHDSKILRCKMCQFTSLAQKYFDLHIKTEHRKDNYPIRRCADCDLNFYSEKGYYRHAPDA